MLRKDFQTLAIERLKDAKALLNANRYTASYYVSGLAFECAVKACLAGKTRRFEFPPKETREYYSHNIEALLKQAGLRTPLHEACVANPELGLSWNVIKDWKVDVRYGNAVSEQMARDMFSGLNARSNGMMAWIRQYW